MSSLATIAATGFASTIGLALLTRHPAVQSLDEKNASPFRSVSMTSSLPRALYGKAPSVAMTNLSGGSLA